MADLRLSGTALRTVRRLATTKVTGTPLWSVLQRDFKIGEVLALPADQRLPLDDTPCPVAGAAPRAWADQNLGAPPPKGDTVAALGAAFREGRSNPVAVFERISARIHANDWGPAHHSPFVALDLDVARKAAEASAARYAAGAPLGPLDGVPVVIKDEADMAGLVTRGGTAYRRTPATRDAWVIERLRAAGAVLYAKTHVPEWGLNPLGFNELFSMPRNAWSTAHAAGGSSTGTGVAVALGLAPVGFGSDGGGSIRIPASLNGVFGIKPTWQRIGRTGDVWGPGSMPHLGPLGASTADLVAFLTATSGRDPGDPSTWLQSDMPGAAAGWQAALGRGVRGCRIGVVRGEWDDVPADLARPAMQAIDALVAAGAVKVDVTIPLASMAAALGALSIAPETAANIDDDVQRHGDQMTEEIRIIHAFMSLVTAKERLSALRARAALRRQTAAALAGCDVLALPTLGMGPASYPLSDDGQPVMDSGATAKTTRYVFLGNLTGLPAASVPVGLAGGLPVGLQLVGDAWDEASVFAVMAQLERSGVTEIGRSSGWRSLLGA